MNGSSAALLETSVVIKHFRDPQAVAEKLGSFVDLFLPGPALGELYAGAYRSERQQTNLKRIAEFLPLVEILTPDEQTPEHYGRIAAQLAKAGTPIPQNDIWIAALALQNELPLWTFDQHFQHVCGLLLIDRDRIPFG